MSEGTYHVYYSPEAKADLRAVYSYIAFSLHAKIAAKAQTNRIREEIRSLSFMPEKYAQVDWEPWHSQGVRKVPVDNYIVYYLVNDVDHSVEIVRIFYGGQDVEGIVGEIKTMPVAEE
nr:type II toxin-antitoxin system RelE/ParE family toxin [uncultured Oscillibacter sp.]